MKEKSKKCLKKRRKSTSRYQEWTTVRQKVGISMDISRTINPIVLQRFIVMNFRLQSGQQNRDCLRFSRSYVPQILSLYTLQHFFERWSRLLFLLLRDVDYFADEIKRAYKKLALQCHPDKVCVPSKLVYALLMMAFIIHSTLNSPEIF